MRGRVAAAAQKGKPPIGLIFSEDKNDADALTHLTSALWPDAPRFKYMRKPLVLIRDRQQAEARKQNAASIANAVRAESVLHDVKVVIAHRDCDAVEPAHEAQAEAIKTELEAAGVTTVIPATPAWEMEAWWFLWPEAVAAVHQKWTQLRRFGNHGMLKDAKEVLRRDLRNKTTRREYEESDAGKIAEKVRTLNIVERQQGTCTSFTEFRRGVCLVAGIDPDSHS